MNPLAVLDTPDAFRKWLEERKGEIVGVIAEGYESPIHQFLAETLDSHVELGFVGRDMIWISGRGQQLPDWVVSYQSVEDVAVGEEDETIPGKMLITADECLRILDEMP